MKHIFRTIIILTAVSFAACKGNNTPVKPDPIVTELNHGLVLFYGAYYEGLPRNVVALDLYSSELNFDDNGYIRGTGTNLYISDIFLPLTDSIPADGTYRCDTTAEVNTFLPGMDFEGTPTGTYLLQIKEDAIAQLILFNDSSFTLKEKDGITDIQFNLTAKDKTYAVHFKGNLKYEDRR